MMWTVYFENHDTHEVAREVAKPCDGVRDAWQFWEDTFERFRETYPPSQFGCKIRPGEKRCVMIFDTPDPADDDAWLPRSMEAAFDAGKAARKAVDESAMKTIERLASEHEPIRDLITENA